MRYLREEHKRKIGLANSHLKYPDALRNKHGQILTEHKCPVCGNQRMVVLYLKDKHPLCKPCSAKERDRKHIEIYGHGQHYRGTKYFSGKLLCQWKDNATSRNYEWHLSYEYLDKLYEKQQGKCALSGAKLSFDDGNDDKISLDRIDSKLGYVENNVQFVATIVNRMKQQYSDDKFIMYCHLVSKNNIK